MKRCFIDTNIFVRYLTADDKAKADRVENLLNKAASGSVKLITADLVLVELIWVLESAYNLHPEDITPMIKAILRILDLQPSLQPPIRFAGAQVVPDGFVIPPALLAGRLHPNSLSELPETPCHALTARLLIPHHSLPALARDLHGPFVASIHTGLDQNASNVRNRDAAAHVTANRLQTEFFTGAESDDLCTALCPDLLDLHSPAHASTPPLRV